MRALLDVRRELRELNRKTDALASFLLMRGRVVEFAGDVRAMPHRAPLPRSTVVCVDEIACRDGNHYVATILVRTAVGKPSYTLLLVEPASMSIPAVTDRLIESMEILEGIVVDAWTG
ncbi:MAG: hypothetical protein JJ863_17505 [Deltaproteobacteria bacterium]|nr:hypothetical protein [Deltaproteobacteria bacterium]